MSNSENMDKQPLSMADLGVALPPTSGGRVSSTSSPSSSSFGGFVDNSVILL